ncbi:MAG TPA: HAD family hydrolase [Acidobacteriota bacterium]|nr:HAD family hydrolase [Acidobacteriota bacterium]
MRFSVLALDYDGTIAGDRGVDPAVDEAIHEVRKHGIAILLVTGRRVSALQDLMGELCCFDAVVAENGAVVLYPATGRTHVLGPPPPQEFLDALAPSVPYARGECVVETDAAAGPAVLEAIRALELPLAMHFNRGRLMILPQSVSKATGLREALSGLRLSPHNAIAIGDAENDHQLLQAVAFGAAVAWGSPALAAVADDVVPGLGPAALAPYLVELARHATIPAGRPGRRQLLLGRGFDGAPVHLPDSPGNVLVAGDPRSGKSWIAGLIAEQWILERLSVFVIDPEGDYRSLEELPEVLVSDLGEPRPRARDIAWVLRHPDLSLVLDLSQLPPLEKKGYVRDLLRVLRQHRKETGLPHRIVLDEAHYFLDREEECALLSDELRGHVLVTYRPSRLPATLLSGADVVVVTRESEREEADALARVVARTEPSDAWHRTLEERSMGEAVLLRRGVNGPGNGQVPFRIAARLTTHVRHRHKYVDVPLPDRLAFVFTRDGAPIGRRARTLGEFVRAASGASREVFEAHVQRGDISTWIAGVFGDGTLAGQAREIENQFRLRRLLDPRDAIVRLIRDRYVLCGPDPDSASPAGAGGPAGGSESALESTTLR